MAPFDICLRHLSVFLDRVNQFTPRVSPRSARRRPAACRRPPGLASRWCTKNAQAARCLRRGAFTVPREVDLHETGETHHEQSYQGDYTIRTIGAQTGNAV